MDEQTWLTSEDVAAMLRRLTGTPGYANNWIGPQLKVSDRKLRLFACACWRLRSGQFDRPNYSVAEYGEALADGLPLPPLPKPVLDGRGRFIPTRADAPEAARLMCESTGTAERPAFAALLRDIVGNPFRPVRFEARATTYDAARDVLVVPASPWLTPTVLRLARGIYDDRDWAALPVLADALEDAGCVEETLLRHLRGQEWCYRRFHPPPWMPLRGPHVRGCWVLDLLLGLS